MKYPFKKKLVYALARYFIQSDKVCLMHRFYTFQSKVAYAFLAANFYLCINSPGELSLCHHDNNPKHSKNQGVVAKALAFLEQRPPVPELISDVLVLLVRSAARTLSHQILTGLALVFSVPFGDHNLQARSV